MSRSVSLHSNRVATVYLFLEGLIQEDEPDGFSYLIEDVRDNVLREKFPSLSKCDRWEGRENHVIAENGRAEVSISEYNGIVAVCLAPLDPYNPLDTGWAEQVSDNFVKTLHKAFPKNALVSQGRFSNGEQAFTQLGKTTNESCITSKEGRLW